MIDAEEYFERNVTLDWSLESLIERNTEPLYLGAREDIILSFNYDPVGVDIVWEESEGKYQTFVYYFDGSGDYTPVGMTLTYEEILKEFYKQEEGNK